MIVFLRRLWGFVRPYRARLILGMICGILYALANVSLAAVIKVTVNFVLGGNADAVAGGKLAQAPAFLREAAEWLSGQLRSVQAPTSKWELAVVICLIPGVMFFRSLFAYLNVYLVNWAAVRAIADLRMKLFGHLQNLSLGFFHSASTGELISRVTNDTQQLQHIIGNSFAALIRDPVTIMALLVYLFGQQWKLTLISMIVFPACIIPISVYSRKVRRSARAMQSHAADLARVMHESFSGNRIIKAYNLEETVAQQFLATTRKYISQIMRVVRANEIPGTVLEFLGSIGIAAVLFYVVFHPDQTATSSGDFFAFVGAIYLMYQPIKTLTRLHNQLHQAQAASHRVFELLDTRSTVREPAAPLPLQAANQDIHFHDVDFDYGEKPVLRGINLTIKAGQLLALVGKSGSGKTTVANLLLRFYDPQRGAIRIGSTDIRDVAIKELRRQIALVTQETILFHDTIRRNIGLGRPGATDAEIEAAAKHANAHEFIMQRPGGYDNVVGEKGAALSGGQRQRIAIARAIVRNAPILILDEATSALDNEAERIVQAAMEELMQSRTGTTLCIAHRLSTIHNAHCIVVLSAGRIVEIGTHAELIRQGGVYQQLYRMDFAETSRLAARGAAVPDGTGRAR